MRPKAYGGFATARPLYPFATQWRKVKCLMKGTKAVAATTEYDYPIGASMPEGTLRDHRMTIKSTEFVRVDGGSVGVSVMLPSVSVTEWFTDGVLKDRDPMVQAAVAEFVQTMHDIAVFRMLRQAMK